MFNCFGLQSMQQRNMPIMLVRKRERAAAILLMQCLLVALGCTALGLTGAFFGLSLGDLSPAFMAISVLHGLSYQSFLIVTVESKSRAHPIRYANQNFVRALLLSCLGLGVAIWTHSAFWVISAEALACSVVTALNLPAAFKRVNIEIGALLKLALKNLPRLPWHLVFVFFCVSMVGFSLINLDRWIAAEVFNKTDFAGYAFAALVLTIAQAAQSMLSASIYPLLARRFAQFGVQHAYDLCLRISLIFLLAGCALALPVWMLSMEAVRRWYPAYSGTDSLLLLFFFVAALRVSDFWSSFLLVTGHEQSLLKVSVICGLLGLGAWLLWLQPWLGHTFSLIDFGWLAFFLTASSYLGFVIECARAKRGSL